jgi:formylglycine-generating enzyme required for sulfatase activity
MGGKIFISYRRDDTEGYAGRIFDHLSKHFGADRVFMDVDSIALGDNFVEVIEDAVSSTSVFIALIGNHWMSAADADGNPRLKDPEDFVRLEIAAALRNKETRVIPVLVHSATMPNGSALPEDLAPLTYRNAMNISHARFIADVDRLTEEIEKYFEKTIGPDKKLKTKTAKFSLPVWGWIVMAALALFLIVFAAMGGLKKKPVETQVAQLPITSQTTPSPTPTTTETQTPVPPTSTGTSVPVIEVIPTDTLTPTPTPTLIPTIATSINVQRGSTSVEMVLIADCLLDEAGNYDETNCDLSPTGDGMVNAFYIDSIPVTNEQYAAFLNENSYTAGAVKGWFDYDHQEGGVAINSNGEWYRKEGHENFPVIAVSWDWAVKFCSYYGGDLPTQDMWEKAARGTGQFFYPWGSNEINSSFANYNNRIGKIVPVKSNTKNISPFGVWDMAGNVWEWTSTQVSGKFALKGGSYFSNDFLLRIDQRKIESPGALLGDFGFRCVCSPADACYSSLVPTPTPNP